MIFSGHANIIDNCLSNPLATYYDIVARDNFIFMMKRVKIQTGKWGNVTYWL